MSQSRSRSTLQASQKRLQSCTAQRKRPASAARAVSPLSHAFLLLVHVVYVPVPFAGGRCGGRARYRKYLACAALRYQYIIRGGVPAMAQTVGTLGLGNARRYSTKLPVCPVLIYCCSCCSLLALFFFVFFPSFSHTCSHPLLLVFIGALARRLQPTYFLFSSKAP